MSTPTPTPSHHAGQALALALEVLRADRQGLIDCHSVSGTIPEADELAAQELAKYDQAISALESLQTYRQRALEALRLADAMLRGAHMDARVVEANVRAAIADLSADPVAEPAKREPLTEGEVVRCLIEAGCIGTVKMSYDTGPYEVTRPSVNAHRLARSIQRACAEQWGVKLQDAGIGPQDKGADHDR